MTHRFLLVPALVALPLVGLCALHCQQTTDPYDYSDRARKKFRSGDIDEALADFKQAIRMSPNVAMFHNDLGIALFTLHRPREANLELETAVRLNPALGESFSNLCLVEIELKEYPAAKSDAQKAVKLKPSDEHAWNNLGVANTKLKRYQEAVDALKKSLKLKPDRFLAHNNLGAALYGLGKKKDALKQWKFVLGHAVGRQQDQAQDYLDHPEHSTS